MATPTRERRLIGGVWQWVTVDQNGGGPGTTPDLAAVLAEGNDANNEQIKNAAEGTDPDDVATVSQLSAGSRSDVSDGGSIVVSQPDLIEFPNAIVDEPSPGVARVVTEGGSQPVTRWGYDRPLFSHLNDDGSSASLFHSDPHGKNVLRATPELPDWDAATDYVIGDRVNNSGSLYVATANNTNSEPPSGDWGASGGFYDYANAGSATWEPTLRRTVAFVRYDNDSGRYDVAVCDVDTLEVTVLTADEEFGAANPAYSPDGQTIAYCGFTDVDGHGSLRAMDADGSNKRTLIEAAAAEKWGVDNQPQWSPDGTQIAVSQNSGHPTADPSNGIYICDADGGNLTQILASGDIPTADEIWYSLSWGANNLLAVTAVKTAVDSAGFNIWTFKPDGSEVTKRTAVTGSGSTANIKGYYWAVWTPDASKWLAVYGDGAGAFDLRLVDAADEDEYVVLATTTDSTFDGYSGCWGQAYDKVPWGSVDMRKAAFVANGSSVDVLRDSLIAAGLVAPS